jgi:hypothetical protein
VPTLATLLLIVVASILPHAESPLPDRIGLTDVFTWAGAFGLMAGFLFIKSSPAKRDQAIRWGGLIGLVATGALYFLALLAQVAFG